jgi:hypothetical protein
MLKKTPAPRRWTLVHFSTLRMERFYVFQEEEDGEMRVQFHSPTDPRFEHGVKIPKKEAREAFKTLLEIGYSIWD